MSTLRYGTPEEAGMLPDRLALARERIEGWIATGDPPCLALVVARRGVICLHEAWGVQSPEGPALARDAIFPVSSVTKPITATLAMILVEEGLLGLNRPLRFYLPELAGAGNERIEVHHLLTHTTGLVEDDVQIHRRSWLREHGMAGKPGPDEHPLVHALLASTWTVPLSGTPGTVMSYCDTNYLLLGEVVRRVAGRPLEVLARERLFGPLGMDDTFYVVPERVRGRVIARPETAPQPVPKNPFFEGLDSVQLQETPYGNTGVFCTAYDLAIFAQLFLNGGVYGGARILSPASVAAMTRNQIPGIGAHFLGQWRREASWGLGWAIRSPEKWRYLPGDLQAPGGFYHGGFGGAWVWGDRENEIAGVLLTVVMNVTENWEHRFDADRLENMISAAVAD